MNYLPRRDAGTFGGLRDGEVVQKDLNVNHDAAADKYAHELRESILNGTSGRIAGMWAEPIQGVGGAMIHCDGYLKKAFAIAREHGGVCISDEVQAGFGRPGEHFWGFQVHDVEPDIVVMAKSMGNGFPMGAVFNFSSSKNPVYQYHRGKDVFYYSLVFVVPCFCVSLSIVRRQRYLKNVNKMKGRLHRGNRRILQEADASEHVWR